ncbi:flavin reductase family protein (plasmid) [Xanthobacter dioxanivorans]|uniref:Flavin reductase family protein n=2 Tax=Pseudomonadota TaxID=1224 RepID=A0A974PV34_9HYPH|nr:flavin reductase family protein [Xanthobacter dioxanivorans]QRG10260.1 flavin reductase family protein [Xanthobacter dioxanivorans]
MPYTAELNSTTIDPIAFRNACGGFATGVTIITTKVGDTEHGMTANAFMSISLDPPLIAISIAKTAKMLEYINKSGRYGVSILAGGSEATAMHFAGRPNESVTDPLRQLDGMPVARNACAVFTTSVEQAVDAGDHVIFVGRVRCMEALAEETPLVFHRGRFGKLHEERSNPILNPDFPFEGGHW